MKNAKKAIIWAKRLCLPDLLPVNFLVLFMQANSFYNVDENYQFSKILIPKFCEILLQIRRIIRT